MKSTGDRVEKVGCSAKRKRLARVWGGLGPRGGGVGANGRQTIAEFLYNGWRGGALLGSTVDEALFVRCDRSTMTQNDLDNGRLVCLIGVAIIKPAEFVIFRISQYSAGAAQVEG